MNTREQSLKLVWLAYELAYGWPHLRCAKDYRCAVIEPYVAMLEIGFDIEKVVLAEHLVSESIAAGQTRRKRNSARDGVDNRHAVAGKLIAATQTKTAGPRVVGPERVGLRPQRFPWPSAFRDAGFAPDRTRTPPTIEVENRYGNLQAVRREASAMQ